VKAALVADAEDSGTGVGQHRLVLGAVRSEPGIGDSGRVPIELSPKIQVMELASETVTVRHSRFDIRDGRYYLCIRHVSARVVVLVDPEDAVVVGVLKM
jgi:hypothetical protein